MTDRPEYVWAVTDHVCGSCLGRILVRRAAPDTDIGREFRCADCGERGPAVGPDAGSICACRHKIGNRNAGVRCVRNERQTPEIPTEIIARDGG
jgi:hypothetical protein